MKSIPINKIERPLENYLIDFLKESRMFSEFICGNVLLPFTNNSRTQVRFAYLQKDHPTLTIIDKNGNDITLSLYKKLFKNHNEYWKTREAFWNFYNWYIEIVKNKQNRLIETIEYRRCKHVPDIIEFFNLTDIFKMLFLREFDIDTVHFQLYPYRKVEKQLETLQKMIVDPEPFIKLYTSKKI